MALLIDKNINILGDISINQIYVRLNYSVSISGDIINMSSLCYTSKNAYQENPNNVLEIEDFPNAAGYDYDRDTQGTDVLLLATQNYKNTLIDSGFTQDSSISIVDISIG
jgi:hypothetical protein